MTLAAQEQLLVLLKHLIAENPPDEQVQRLSKGLTKALDRWLQTKRPAQPDQARIGRPRTGLAAVNASLVSQQEMSDGESTRPQGPNSDR